MLALDLTDPFAYATQTRALYFLSPSCKFTLRTRASRPVVLSQRNDPASLGVKCDQYVESPSRY